MTYEEYYNQWESSVQSRDMAFDEWLCLMLNRQKKLDIDKACEAHCSLCRCYVACKDRGEFYCFELEEIKKVMEG